MKTLEVYIEIQGEQRHVGQIIGNDHRDACFKYDEDYISSDYGRPISISMPLRSEAYTSEETRCFFEGLLPEGFSRKAVANWIKTAEDDYITILSVLGKECLGAIRIVQDDSQEEPSKYKKLTMGQVKKLAEEGATKSTKILMQTHLSLAGATGKVGLYYDSSNDRWFLPQGNAPSTHIVKQSHVRLAHIVLNEELCMLAAKNCGIEAVDSFIVNTGDGNDSDILYATRRYDRAFINENYVDGLQIPNRLHQEDFAQAMGIDSFDKYEREDKHYLRRLFEIIRSNCTDPIAEQIKLWKMICYNFLVGNTDCHIKNMALLYGENLKNISLAPAYDIVSTRVYNMSNEMSFYIGGELRIDQIKRSTFASAAGECGLTERIALKCFDEVADSFESAITKASEKLYDKGFKDSKKLKKDIMKHCGYSSL